MARYDFYRRTERDGYLLDVKADLLEGLNTRVVIPLMPPSMAPVPGRRLTPPSPSTAVTMSCHSIHVSLDGFF
ncbi:CcdB family protein [Mesorhizobium sp.]|uniref:CcdB family protein n=1 Tax=Mesorhizobium sp. TaxID=1871066 RepID=UPI0025DD4A05|nr:CcdB family protein [Mesorhizobium sp.]